MYIHIACAILGVLTLTATVDAEISILAFAGSTRESSYNRILIELAANIAREQGAKVTLIDLKEFPMPFYDAALEQCQGMPATAKALRALMISSDAIMISSPEYNASISAILKNTLDWTSRNEQRQASRDAFKGKKFAIMGAAAGAWGGARALAHLRDIIQDIGGEVVSRQVTVPRAYELFDNSAADMAPLKKALKEEIEQLLK